MENYIMTLKHAKNGLKIEVKDYDGTLEQLRTETGSRTVMLYDAVRMLPLICTPYNKVKAVLVVCDDDGKIFGRPVTMPILSYDLHLVDEFVGDLCFIASKPYPNECDDRGLTREEAETLIDGVTTFLEMMSDDYPKVTEVHKCYE